MEPHSTTDEADGPKQPTPPPQRRGRRRRGRALRRAFRRRWPYPETYVPGNRVTVYEDGPSCFDGMIEAIASAQQTIHLETYILQSDRVGWRFADILATRAQEGLEVALMYDAMGGLGVSAKFLSHLTAAGVRVVAYHPLWPWKPGWSLTRRNHRKILVVDGRVGFVGGMNISEVHLAEADGGGAWRDTHVRLEGPAAIALDRLFIAEWVNQGGPALSEPTEASSHVDGVPVRVVENRDLIGRTLVRGAYLDALQYANRRIWITNSYFVPDRKFVRALLRAAARGVDVRIMVAGRSDVRIVQWAGEHIYERLLAGGVRLFAWSRSVLHAKTAVVDGRWLTVGTYNFDHRSLRYNIEVNAMVLDEAVAQRMEGVFLRDLERCEELTRAGWRRRPWTSRLRGWFFWLFRAWL